MRSALKGSTVNLIGNEIEASAIISERKFIYAPPNRKVNLMNAFSFILSFSLVT
jgi:hypothetical protein